MSRFRQMNFRAFGTYAVMVVCGVLIHTPLEAQVFGSSFETVAITAFSGSPSTIATGQSTTLNWTTLSATECTATGGTDDWAQTIITLPGGSQPVTISEPGTYEFTLTCQGNFGDSAVENTTVVVHESVAITAFFASPSTIVEGQSTVLSWAMQNATSCTPTGGAGGWSQTTITIPDGIAELTINTPGTHEFTLTCQGEAGDSAVENVSVVVNESVEITGFSAEPSTIVEGESTTLSWTTLNAVECTATGGAGDWAQTIIALPGGSQPVTISEPGTYEFTLTCQGEAGDSTVENTTVVVDSATVCGTPALSVGLDKLWEEFWGVDFPGPVASNVQKAIPKNGYMAIEFNTGDVVDDGKLTLLEFAGTTGIRRGTISECPGDFDFDFGNDPTKCSFTWGLGGGLRWATNGRSDACQLKPNTDYYFNVTFTDGVDDTTSTCVPLNALRLCKVEIQHSNP